MGSSQSAPDRKQLFEDGLLTLLKDRPYEAISVKDLTDHLQIARKTFYQYFPNKHSCLESMTDRLILECNLHTLQSLTMDADLMEYYRIRLAFWVEHREFLEIVIRNHLSAFFLSRFLEYIKKEDPALIRQLCTANMDCDDDILFFYFSGQIYLLLKWCADGFPLTDEEMARKIIRLICEPLCSQTSDPIPIQ